MEEKNVQLRVKYLKPDMDPLCYVDEIGRAHV